MQATKAPTEQILLTDIQAAQYYGVSVDTVRKWRIQRKGPKWIKLAGSSLVRYRRTDLDAFLDNSPVGGASEVHVTG